LNRRDFMSLLGGAAIAWPLAARGQQRTMHVIGTLHPASTTRALADFRQGLKEEGFVEGQNVAIVSRSADGELDRLSSLLAEIVQLRVGVIVPFGTAATLVVQMHKAGIGAEIPIVFSYGRDPVVQGLVPSLNRPGGNVTGVTSMADELAPKRLGLVRELVPGARTIGLLMNPNSLGAEPERRDLEVAARALGMDLRMLHAARVEEFGHAFANSVDQRVDALIIGVDTFFFDEIVPLARLAAQHGVPTIGPLRQFAVAGGLMSFGASIPEVNRRAGIYAAKVLKGAKPADLPVLRPTKFELVINLKAAKALGVTVPLTLQATADEMIE